MRFLITILLACMSSLGLLAQARFNFTPELVEAHKDILALRMNEGRNEIAAVLAKGSNPAATFIEDYADFLECFIREEEKYYAECLKRQENRLAIIRKAEDSPYKRYAEAEILLHRAILRFKFRDYRSSGSDLRTAYLLLEENTKKYPAFLPQLKSLGTLEILVGTLPSRYSWIAGMLGLKGSINDGLKRIEKFIYSPQGQPHEEVLKEEALFTYAFLKIHVLKQKEDAWKIVEPATIV